MNILIVEPYYTGSHAAWAEGYKKNSRHNVDILSLPGRSWKWRMHGGAVTLARDFLAGGLCPDLILATDMLDLSTFAALTRPLSNTIPAAVYFHENQFTYPWHPDDRDRLRGRDSHYGFINFVSALAAERVFFNSAFHLESFLRGLEGYLARFPDFDRLFHIDNLRKKSSVLYVGMDFSALDAAAEGVQPPLETLQKPPLILWNHRWEYDKNPDEFFRALYVLMDRGLEFEVAVLGENFQGSPAVFKEARERLGDRVLHFGFVQDLRGYAAWLKRADILPVTSRHDFFGCSVVEAIYSGCFPILPRALAYPEHLQYGEGDMEKMGGGEADEFRDRCFYDDFEGLVDSLEWSLLNIDIVRRTSFKAHVTRYGWPQMALVYDREMEQAARAGPAGAKPAPAP
ncbi:MAG: DUF3524 domain-containing protein [Thermodesulfobacteriota bacterium]